MYANFWITGTLFIVGGYFFSLNHARLVVLMATIYAIYFVKVRVGWHGVFLSINLTFLSNDVLNFLLQWCDNINESKHFEEQKESETVMRDEFSPECEYSVPTDESEKLQSCKSSSKPAATSSVISNQNETFSRKVVREEISSADEMRRILNSVDHYEALGFPRHKRIDATILRREYRKKAMLVHPDKNMGSPLASESFKKLQCAYEVLSDSSKKWDYDEQLRKEESKTRSVCQKSHGTHQANQDYCSEESRRIQCTKCHNSHIWVCTNRSKAKARWCQDCCQYHQAKDGDGWVEYKGSLVFDRPQKVEIPCAFVCAESKIFDVSEWAICQGMACRPNTHRPSFHVNMVGLEKTPRSKSSRFPWDLDAEMMDENEEEFELWLQQALASGLFSETSTRRKSWSPFKLHQKKGKKQWRRSST
ncbi:dnaJ homolog dnj-5 isoform X2 [Manihot esculenta]|nr:dnaJ homolog dnj-5 isoform X2 [Manihot esculenta]